MTGSNNTNDELSLELPSPNTRSIRTRCAMIVHSIESELGDYVLEHASTISDLPSSQVDPVLARKRARQDDSQISQSKLSAVAEESYLGEILDLAIAVAKNSPDEDDLKRLKSLINDLDIFTIRNSHDHPNRTFPTRFWHRAATIATDQLIDRLQFYSVREAYNAAIEGRLQRPPEDWNTKTKWIIENNLPHPFDHDLTGLVGRRDAVNDLKKYLKKPRVNMVAVSAKGGLGKTALVLEALRDIAVSPKSHEWVDRIVYVSAKTEHLTAGGIEKLDSPGDSIDDAKKRIYEELRKEGESTEEMINRTEDDRVLICIDNLETLLIDAKNQDIAHEEFEKFHLHIPENWKLIVTSRVKVEGATKNFPISPLDEEDSKILARKYAQMKFSESIEQEVVEKISEAASDNPLAIRLIIDSLVAGSSVDEAISETKQDVLEFSYSNLIKYLPDVAEELLECLFVVQKPLRRFTAASLLERSREEVAEGFSHLLKTSLCTRVSASDGERYELSASVRNLLLREPVNLDARHHVEERQREIRKTGEYQEQRMQEGTSPLSVFHVSDDLEPSIQHSLQKGFDAIKADSSEKGRMAEVVNELESAARENEECLELRRVAGVLRLKLDDTSRGTALLNLSRGLNRRVETQYRLAPD